MREEQEKENQKRREEYARIEEEQRQATARNAPSPPSIWEINAEKSREALRNAEAQHSRATNPNSGSGCNSSVYGCR